uniref:GTA902 n=1 Tax=Arundo donax TaxID=35708 RepID=A0A0A9F2R2_ARUDO
MKCPFFLFANRVDRLAISPFMSSPGFLNFSSSSNDG